MTTESPELSIEELLAAVESKPKVRVKTTDSNEPSITWVYSDSTYECLQCKRVYHGKLFHSTANPPSRRYTAWCPKCIDSTIFWLHHQFTTERVEEPKTD